MRKILFLFTLALSSVANAQFTPGQILTAGQLNSQFALYAPLAGANFSGIVSASGFTGTPISGSTGSFTNLTASGTVSLPSGSVPAGSLASQAGNSFLGNVSNSVGVPSAISFVGCSGSTTALNYLGGTGFTCNSSINAATLGGATFASPGAIGSSVAGNGTFTNLTANTSITLPSQVANSIIANVSNVSAIPTVVSLVGCSGASTALNYLGGTGFSCNNSINAVQLNGSTFASPPAAGYGSTTPEPVAATTITATDSITPSQTSGIVGTTTNNNVNAGGIGEYITATSASTAISNATITNITSISLTAGDWDVSGNVNYATGASSTLTTAIAGVSTTSVTLPASPLYTQISGISVASTTNMTASAFVQRLSLSSTTTVYLVGEVLITGTCTSQGIIRARRVR